MTKREKRDIAIVANYFEGKTLAEVAKKYKISDERVRQILLGQGYSARANKVSNSKFKVKLTPKMRFCKRIVIDETRSNCWIWQSKDKASPRFSYTTADNQKVSEYANRASRKFFLGVDGKRRLKNVCKNLKCVHPLHWVEK